MICYIYDGSFEGLLTAIYDAYYRKDKPEEILREDEFIPTLITNPIYIKKDISKFSRVYDAIKAKISYNSLRYIFYVHLSDMKGSSTLIYKYIKLGFKLGKDIDMHLHKDCVLQVHQIVRKVFGEYHRMLGFVRFSSINDKFFYSPIEPDHNILALITPHFANRLSNENFIIHDLKRGIAAVYDKTEWSITQLSKEYGLTLLNKNSTSLYEELWKSYFKSTTIKDRINPKLQKGHMPKRYWSFLTEVN